MPVTPNLAFTDDAWCCQETCWQRDRAHLLLRQGSALDWLGAACKVPTGKLEELFFL